MQKWGALACLVLAVASVIAPLIYLVGDLRHALGPLSYDLADFLYGPLWAASLVTTVVVLREQTGERASRRMLLALLAAALAAAAMVGVACIRSANRHYHLLHPELHLETASMVLVVWTTIVAGLTGAGRHLLGWAWVLVGWSGWTTRFLPRALSVLYLLAGAASWFAYLGTELEGGAVFLGMVASIWQGILLWRAGVRR